MNAAAPSLLSMLESRAPTPSSIRRLLAGVCADLGLDEGQAVSPVCVAYALLKLGAQPDEVSKLLTWREFEQVSASILGASGYEVRENLILTKPRAQLDIVATGPSLVLNVDCKHYQKGNSPSALAKFAKDQLKRSGLLRSKTNDSRPIASVILSMSEYEGRFVGGAAIVPVRTLRSFITTVDSYIEYLELK